MNRLSRRAFLQSVAATAAAGCATTGSPARTGRKPNLLFIWTDEQRADTMAVYGNRRIHTPNLNRLAGESVVFEHAYVSQPVCTPSRSTVMTGLWPHQNGCTQNNIALAERVKTLPELVGDNDYRTGYYGKWHLGDELFAQRGFEEWRSIEDIYWRYFREGRDTDQISDYSRWLLELGYEPNEDRGAFSRSFAAELPIEHSKPKFLETQACDFLRRHRDEPFMLYVNFLEPHMPFYGPLNDEHGPDEVAFPLNFDDPLEENEPKHYRERQKKFQTTEYGDKDIDLTGKDGWHRLIRNYWGLVSQVDRSVGAILATLENLGLAEDTIVVYTSDHGDMMGSHRMAEKSVMYQEAMRVPWLMRVPRQGRRQQVMPGHYSHIDLVPTLLELMGAEGGETLPGGSLVPAVQAGRPNDEPVFIEWNAPERMEADRNPAGARRDATRAEGLSSRAVIMPNGWKLCLHDRDLGQLYDLARDPGETANLYGRSEYSEVVSHGTRLIEEWQARSEDTLEL